MLQLDIDGLRNAVSNSQIISRGLLYDLTAKNIATLPNRAIDCVERILLRSRAPNVPIDMLERATYLCFWKVDENFQISLLGDWSQLLWLAPDFLNLMPCEIQLIHNARMEGLRKRDALLLSMKC
jgi:hypothetical protein